MTSVNTSPQDGALITVKERFRVTTKGCPELKIVHRSFSERLARVHSQGLTNGPGSLLVDFDSPQTGPHQESRQKELEHRYQSRKLAKSQGNFSKTLRNGRRVSSWHTKTLRSLAPAKDTRQSQLSGSVPRALDSWMIHEVPACRFENNVIRSYLDILVLRTYPYGWPKTLTHPLLGTADIYANIMQDLSLLNCTISIGIITDVVHHRAKNPQTVALYCAKLHNAINALLTGPDDLSRQIMIVHGIVTLALKNLMMGEHHEWHIHMNGLRSLMSDQSSLPPSLRWLAVRTDLIGSCDLGVKPYLSIQRCYPPILDKVDVEAHKHIRTCLRRSLSICCSGVTIETFISVGLLTKLVESSGAGSKLEPDPLMEQSYILWNELLSRPIPMWELQKFVPSQQVLKLGQIGSTTKGAIEAFAFPRCIECAIRIALLLYAKKMSSYKGDLVWNQPALLASYTYCLRETLAGLQQSTNINATTPQHHILIAQEVLRLTRPALIWLCLMGWMFGKMYSASQSDMALCRELLIYIVGSDATETDTSPDWDLQFCRIYNLEVILGHKWNARSTIETVVSSSINS